MTQQKWDHKSLSMRSLIQRLEEATGHGSREDAHAEFKPGDIVRTNKRALARLIWSNNPIEKWVNRGTVFIVHSLDDDTNTVDAVPLDAHDGRQYYTFLIDDVELSRR